MASYCVTRSHSYLIQDEVVSDEVVVDGVESLDVRDYVVELFDGSNPRAAAGDAERPSTRSK